MSASLIHLVEKNENCDYCKKTIAKTHLYVKCQVCNSKLHIKCNNMDRYAYKKLGKNKEIVLCALCNETLPFQENNKKLSEHYNQDHISSNNKIFFQKHK